MDEEVAKMSQKEKAREVWKANSTFSERMEIRAKRIKARRRKETEHEKRVEEINRRVEEAIITEDDVKEAVGKILNYNSIEFEREYEFVETRRGRGMSADIYLPDTNISIECKGGRGVSSFQRGLGQCLLYSFSGMTPILIYATNKHMENNTETAEMIKGVFCKHNVTLAEINKNSATIESVCNCEDCVGRISTLQLKSLT